MACQRSDLVKPLQNLEKAQKIRQSFRISINECEVFRSEMIVSLHNVTAFMV